MEQFANKLILKTDSSIAIAVVLACCLTLIEGAAIYVIAFHVYETRVFAAFASIPVIIIGMTLLCMLVVIGGSIAARRAKANQQSAKIIRMPR